MGSLLQSFMFPPFSNWQNKRRIVFNDVQVFSLERMQLDNYQG